MIKSSLQVVGLSLATALMLGCPSNSPKPATEVPTASTSGSVPVASYAQPVAPPTQPVAVPAAPSEDGYVATSSPVGPLQAECIKVKDTEFCSIASEVSSDEQTATELSTAAAQAALAGQIQAEVERVLDRATINNVDKEALKGSYILLGQKVGGKYRNVITQDIMPLYNKDEGKYKVYVRVSAKKDEVGKAVIDEISADKVLADAAKTKIVMDEVKNHFKKN